MGAGGCCRDPHHRRDARGQLDGSRRAGVLRALCSAMKLGLGARQPGTCCAAGSRSLSRNPDAAVLITRYAHLAGDRPGDGGERNETELKVKRMNLNVEVSLHDAFKAATAAHGVNMTDVLLRLYRGLRQEERAHAEEGSSLMKRAALYMRVSTIDQHPETQLHDLRGLAAQRGFEIVERIHRQDQRRQSEAPRSRSTAG